MSPVLLGVDCGQTRLKAVVFDDSGRELGHADEVTTVDAPQDHAAERDMVTASHQLDAVIIAALADAQLPGHKVGAVGIVAHGDGIYPVDADGMPTRPAFLALDGRSTSLLQRWQKSGLLADAVVFTGQHPHAGSLAPLLAWWHAHEPETLAATRHLLYCKDWLRYTLTGQIATDTVEASSSVGRMDGRGYSAEALHSYGLGQYAELLPPVLLPTDIAGAVNDEAANRTGLRSGTPVVTGTHDVVASALGSGCTSPGDCCVQAGTYSVNQLIWDRRMTDTRWQARPWIVDDQWVLMGASPSSASNLEWFVRRLMPDVADPFTVANVEVSQALQRDSALLFHPFLTGSPYGAHAAGSFLGLRSWHNRPQLLRAVYEGVTFNHRMHLDAFLEFSDRKRIHLSGGASRSPVWAQLFADILNSELVITDSREHGALGAAMLAGIGTGVYQNVEQATRACVRDHKIFHPDPAASARYDLSYQRYLHSIDVVAQLWTNDESFFEEQS